jgi:hypothetical protein
MTGGARVRDTPDRRGRIAPPRAAALALLVGAMVVQLSSPAIAQPSAAPLFSFGAQQIGFSTGYGQGVAITTAGAIDGQNVSELVLVAHWQIAVTRAPIDPAWYKGVLALRIEPSLLVEFGPHDGVAGGVAAMLRYELTRWGETIPYFEAGAGIIGLDFGLVEQADGLAFNPTAGIGVLRRFGDHWALDVAVRFQHVSNAYTQFPNGGFDTFQYLAGLAYRF